MVGTAGDAGLLRRAPIVDKFRVKAVTPDQYEAWAQQQADDIEAAGKALGEQRKSGEGQVIPK